MKIHLINVGRNKGNKDITVPDASSEDVICLAVISAARSFLASRDVDAEFVEPTQGLIFAGMRQVGTFTCSVEIA